MAQKKRKSKRPNGHYCKICGEYKANEKFSGKGHAAHICKACAKLSPAEQAEAQTVTRLWNLPGRRLNDSEKKWLDKRVHDKRPEVAEAAREVRNILFPFAERNERKRQLDIAELTFEMHTEVYDEYGDSCQVNQDFEINRGSRVITLTDLDKNGETQSVKLDGKQGSKLLRWIVHTLEIFMWPEDYQLKLDPEWDDPDQMGEDDEREEEVLPEPEKEPYWRVQIAYCTGEKQDIACYEDWFSARPGLSRTNCVAP